METIIKNKIKQIKKGDQNAFAEIVELFKDKVYQLCYRMVGNAHDAEDLAQEAFIRAFLNIHSYDVNRKFSTWLYRIATNLSIDRLRKRKPDYFLDADIDGTEGFTMYSQIPSDDMRPEDVVESLEFQERIQQEINKLPVLYRSVIVLKYIDDMSLKEIGEILDLPIGTVKTRLHRGREALRKRLRNV